MPRATTAFPAESSALDVLPQPASGRIEFRLRLVRLLTEILLFEGDIAGAIETLELAEDVRPPGWKFTSNTEGVAGEGGRGG